MGGTEWSSATPAAEGVPHGGMGGVRTDGGHSVTGPIHRNSIGITEKEMLPGTQIRLKFKFSIVMIIKWT